MSAFEIQRAVTARLARAAKLLGPGKVGLSVKHEALTEQCEAWRMLWRAAFLGGGDIALQKSFEELFPPTPELQIHLDQTLPAIRGRDGGAAQTTAKNLVLRPKSRNPWSRRQRSARVRPFEWATLALVPVLGERIDDQLKRFEAREGAIA